MLHRAENDEGSEPRLSLKTRLYAWWEGYDLSGLKRRGKDHDGKEHALAGAKAHPSAAASAEEKPPRPGELDRHGKPLWSASRIEVAEKIWGEGFVSPGGDEHIPYLLKPLGLNSAMSALDLSAGMGGTVRMMATKFSAWATGLEASPVLAERGMAQSTKHGMAQKAPIEHYDPENFSYGRRFDCAFAKETFFTVQNKAGLIEGVLECIKSPGQLLFTDYVVEANPRSPEVIRNWADHEPLEPHVWTVDQWSALLRKERLDVRIVEDISDTHIHSVLTAIKTLTDFLEQHAMDRGTKVNVVDEVEMWARRVAALQAGLRCYRFFALKG
ncbi:MAG TPA: methyltransferase domain-containing protein [Azospirillaceae bacterium]|nr:methyltransferase domain-containing protein [Azospirillaceae bacterium]